MHSYFIERHSRSMKMFGRRTEWLYLADDQLQTAAILGSDFDDDACSHIESSNQTTAFGNPPNVSLH